MSDDPFDSVINIEDEFEDSGYIMGLEAGKSIGTFDGRVMGCENGFDLGKDLGFYQGWTQQWLKAADTHPEIVPARVQKKLLEIQAILDEVPMTNIEGANFADRLKQVQKKFKVVSAMLGTNTTTELASNSLSY